jgi:carbonic anhydrase
MRRWMILVIALVVCVPLAAEDINGCVLWKALLTGNLKYEAGEITYTGLQKERKDLAKKQEPPVTILSCSDSRVPPELVFNQSLGSLFVVRVAGNVADELALASIEYAVAKKWTKLIVVLGHENCGAVGEALEHTNPPTPSLVALVDRIRASFVGIAWNGGGETDLTKRAVQANARASAAWLTAHSPTIRDAVIAGTVKIIPAYYTMESGEVTAIDPACEPAKQ